MEKQRRDFAREYAQQAPPHLNIVIPQTEHQQEYQGDDETVRESPRPYSPLNGSLDNDSDSIHSLPDPAINADFSSDEDYFFANLQDQPFLSPDDNSDSDNKPPLSDNSDSSDNDIIHDPLFASRPNIFSQQDDNDAEDDYHLLPSTNTLPFAMRFKITTSPPPVQLKTAMVFFTPPNKWQLDLLNKHPANFYHMSFRHRQFDGGSADQENMISFRVGEDMPPTTTEDLSSFENPDKLIYNMHNAWGWRAISAGIQRYQGGPWTIEDINVQELHQRFVSLPCGLVWQINLDWFQSVKRGSYSTGALYMTCCNNPRGIWYLTEETFLIIVIPGPKEPKVEELNKILKPFVNDMLNLYESNLSVFLDIKTKSPPTRSSIVKYWTFQLAAK
ncbi:hypothetical protein SERLA73DRAFT_153261 [Serpula lacrymans var. lacrymans S7.3]|uniref:Uncharacterized protein n=1 Tax=Serpula lacrymans var. lacrymans (strain S7.3) TaxID=936435 RepID=F8Q193_SERL3|nr:hypothetical protein SERLA73DRAFT_153261 [Serpula lacrymans var. lacrymans S7.3]